MKLPKLRFWSQDEKLDGLIFFAQSIDEMLFHFSIDSYKSPVCNVHSLLEELTQSLNEAEKMNLEKNGNVVYTKPIREEFLNKIDTDFVAKRILETRYGKNGYSKILHDLNHWTNNEEYLIFIESLNSLFGEEYFNEIKTQLHDSINKCNYSEIQALCLAFIPELILQTYSPEFIY